MKHLQKVNKCLEQQTIRRLRAALLRWYDRHHRKLPWRAAPRALADPYRVLVSETMLQQTQVATVIDYFERFVARWPRVERLAGAEEQEVLRLWQGLGYYRRARNLHAAAKYIVHECGGRIPDTVEELLKLPGVGRYTAGAIASIAFGQRAAVLDGNVARVLTRWLALEEPIDDAAARAFLWRVAEELVPTRRGQSGDFNQAMMELGAVVCTPRQAKCLMCPVASMCRANQQGMVERLPVRAKPQAAKAVTHHVVAIRRGDSFLFERRPAAGLWSNMWQLPTAEDLPDEVDAGALRTWAWKHCGMRLNGVQRVGTFAHQTTHRAISFVVWQSKVRGRTRTCAEPPIRLWRELHAVDDLPLSKAQQRALEAIRNESAAQ